MVDDDDDSVVDLSSNSIVSRKKGIVKTVVLVGGIAILFVTVLLLTTTRFFEAKIGSEGVVNAGSLKDYSDDIKIEDKGSVDYEADRKAEGDKTIKDAELAGKSAFNMLGASDVDSIEDVVISPMVGVGNFGDDYDGGGAVVADDGGAAFKYDNLNGDDFSGDDFSNDGFGGVDSDASVVNINSNNSRFERSNEGGTVSGFTDEVNEDKKQMLIGLMNIWSTVPGGETVVVYEGKNGSLGTDYLNNAGDRVIATSDIAGEADGDVLKSPILTGEIIYARTMIGLSSDIATQAPEVLVEIIGPARFSGYRMIGAFKPIDNLVVDSRLVLRFHTLRSPNGIIYPVSGLAVNPADAEAAIATDVDSHFILRSALLLSSSLFTGVKNVADAIVSQKTEKTINVFGGGGGDIGNVGNSEPFSGRDQAIIVGGGVAGDLADQAKSYRSSIPPVSVKVNAGTELAIIIL